MPQLNPLPWLFYLFMAWLIFLLLTPTKILNHTNLNEPGSKSTKTNKFMWTWPW
ncbi:ATPase subunit 8 (mitochondrion) [Aquarana catesbeiana]|uniref:ATP synthase complex subunit 8 n=1 Tax=Aquarana catesbeiana TaxID=8400 RepID=U3M277_AQUCT|nr:ATP synthase F0 subunit 8 [Aquarana catesbeiana]YP_010568165.1 ATP synthase F0 subunit 8 [Limnonectes khasianus]AGS43916.1 ATP synthase F0 subunit 8 [Aquarana catesbeiana]APY20706.1 ATPase subunit 8 [Aquarana catesbeiana]QHD18511.1 ATP synthase F0 subunit 8 [Aquarana catesbeiana]UZC57585.1 ATP synthase F0 subunit 8 [Aquarana catesbeiana]BAO04501.1 ATPase subunit 8 [Aquarana catesbeiana]